MFKLDAEDQAAVMHMVEAIRPSLRRWIGFACAILGSAIVLGVAYRLFELVAGV